jgi:hypothetical protein
VEGIPDNLVQLAVQRLIANGKPVTQESIKAAVAAYRAVSK